MRRILMDETHLLDRDICLSSYACLCGATHSRICQTGLQFAVHEAFDQTAFILALAMDDKRRLQEERGLRFAKL